jgi:hypothetical protein
MSEQNHEKTTISANDNKTSNKTLKDSIIIKKSFNVIKNNRFKNNGKYKDFTFSIVSDNEKDSAPITKYKPEDFANFIDDIIKQTGNTKEYVLSIVNKYIEKKNG